jgi:GTPase SAR1 family protein
MYYQGSRAAIVVFSLADEATVKEAQKWLNELHEQLDTLPWTWVVGNKVDLQDERQVSLADGARLAENYNAQYLEASAKTGQNIRELFEGIADIVQSEKNPETAPPPVPVPIKKKSCDC